MLGIRWYRVKKGLVCLYILENVETWSDVTDAWHTYRQQNIVLLRLSTVWSLSWVTQICSLHNLNRIPLVSMPSTNWMNELVVCYTWFIVEKFKLIRIWLVLRGFVMKYSQIYNCQQVSSFVMVYKASSVA